MKEVCLMNYNRSQRLIWIWFLIKWLKMIPKKFNFNIRSSLYFMHLVNVRPKFGSTLFKLIHSGLIKLKLIGRLLIK